MNTMTYAVIHSPNGSTPTVMSKNDRYWFDCMQSGYTILHEGTQRECNQYLEEFCTELNTVNFYN